MCNYFFYAYQSLEVHIDHSGHETVFSFYDIFNYVKI